MQFTGNRNTDYIILSQLGDKDLFNFCLTNKYISGLCKNETF